MTDEQAFVERIQKDPEFFFREVLGDELWPRQVEIAESVRDNSVTAVPSCHSSGKSFCAGRIVLWFLFAFPDSVVVTTAPTERQVKLILWKEIAKAHASARVSLGGKLDTMRLQVHPVDHPGWEAFGFTAPDWDPNRFQGIHAEHILVVLDEAAGITQPIMEQVESLGAGGHSRRLEIGNPVETGTPFEASCKSDMVNVLPISAFDTPNFTEAGIREEDMFSGAWEAKAREAFGGGEPIYPRPYLITPSWAAQILSKWGADSKAWRTRVKGEFPEVVVGAYYGEQMKAARGEGRITRVPFEKGVPIVTAWDLGIRDSTSIWFAQYVGREPRILYYYENDGEGLAHYVDKLRELQDTVGWKYDRHLFPHDVKARELGSGKTRIETLREMGVTATVVAQHKVEDGIEAARRLIQLAWWDRESCEDGLDCLEHYKREMNPRTGELRNTPLHDWASHGADAWRILAMGLQAPKTKRPRRERVGLMAG